MLSDAGERDTYQLGGGRSYIWDSGDQLLTEVRGPQTYRLPRPADLVPPALALRLLSEAGRQASYRVIAPVRVAGRNAAGLRVTPADPASTIGRVDVWADPSQRAAAAGRDLRPRPGPPGPEKPVLPGQHVAPGSADADPGAGRRHGIHGDPPGNLAGALSNLGLVALPAELGGRIRQPVQPGFEEIGVYGGGLSTFVVLGVRGSDGRNLIPDAISAGGTPLPWPAAPAW